MFFIIMNKKGYLRTMHGIATSNEIKYVFDKSINSIRWISNNPEEIVSIIRSAVIVFVGIIVVKSIGGLV